MTHSVAETVGPMNPGGGLPGPPATVSLTEYL